MSMNFFFTCLSNSCVISHLITCKVSGFQLHIMKFVKHVFLLFKSSVDNNDIRSDKSEDSGAY